MSHRDAPHCDNQMLVGYQSWDHLSWVEHGSTHVNLGVFSETIRIPGERESGGFQCLFPKVIDITG